MKNVGVVDSEYIVHLGLPTLGVIDDNKASIMALCLLMRILNKID